MGVQTQHPTRMGGCCSKCGNYLLGTPQGEAQGGDTPKLSRLQHKESFNGPQKTLTNGHENGDVKTAPDGDATPKKGDPRDRPAANGDSGGGKATEELLKSETVTAGANKNATENNGVGEHGLEGGDGNVTSITVSEIPQVSKVLLGGDTKEEVKVIQKNEESTQNSSMVMNESTTVSVTQASSKESKEVAEKTVVVIKNEENANNETEERTGQEIVNVVEQPIQNLISETLESSSVQKSSSVVHKSSVMESSEMSSSISTSATNEIESQISSSSSDSQQIQSSSIMQTSEMAVPSESNISSQLSEMSESVSKTSSVQQSSSSVQQSISSVQESKSSVQESFVHESSVQQSSVQESSNSTQQSSSSVTQSSNIQESSLSLDTS